MAQAKVMVVEDEVIVGRNIQMSLQNLDYAVPTLVTSGEKAIEAAGNEKPDLIVMDITLRGAMDGIEAATHIRSQLDVPVIYLTANTDDEILQRAKVTEPYGYIVKPFEQRELHSAIQMALHKHRMERKLKDAPKERHSLITSIPEVTWITTRAGKTVFISPNVEKVLGYTPQAIYRNGNQWLDRVHPDDVEKVARTYEGLLKNKVPFDIQYQVRRNGGAWIWVHDRGVPLHKNDGVWCPDSGLSQVSGPARRLMGNLFSFPTVSAGEPTECQTLTEESTPPIRGAENLLDTEREAELACLIMLRDITESKHAERELKDTLEKLRKVLGNVIQTVALTIEKRDPYTAGHQKRVADLARSIATEMGLLNDQIDGIRMAGLIHDLGKIAVPAEILSKPYHLTPIEFEMIKTHTRVGYDILKSIEFPFPIAKIVLQHHEKIDGSGYPQGLTHDNTLLEARILTVADVVEAIASHRPYRPALGIEKALQEITQKRGTHYDPEVVDACLKVLADKSLNLL
jgi:PAS domain S-box-containing protein/putative nucleotidyltransferase with HDIG domain